MKTFRAFVIKLIFVSVFTSSIYSIFPNTSISRLLLMSLIVSALSFLGDLFLLPRMNQALAILADGIGLFVLYLILGNMFFDNMIPLVLPAFATTFFIGVCEAFFHMYMMEDIHGGPRIDMSVGSLRMEASEEFNSNEIESMRKNEED